MCTGGRGEYNGVMGGRGPQTDKLLPQSPFTGQFLDNDIWLAFYQSNLSTGPIELVQPSTYIIS